MARHLLRGVLLLALLSGPSLTAQDPAGPRTELANAGFEEGAAGEAAPGWYFHARLGATHALVGEGALEGGQCALIDAREATGDGFCNLMQSLDATPWRGKRLRYRVAVKTADLVADGGAQLWMRVDGPNDRGGMAQVRAFDNMGDRPIRAADWQHYEIVLDVAGDSEAIALGALVLGNGRVWIDAASFAEAPADAAATGSKVTRSSLDPRVAKALGEAADAPQQSFWTWWLTLPAIATLLFFVGMWPLRRLVTPASGSAALGVLRAFPLRFTVCYWGLYCIPIALGSVLAGTAGFVAWLARFPTFDWLGDTAAGLAAAGAGFGTTTSSAVGWMTQRVAEVCFDFEGELVPPNGSGDTTMGYLTVLCWFAFALLLAAGWTVLKRGWPSRDASVDLLRSLLRYSLAFMMLGYGLAKLSLTTNQFPELDEWRLVRTWGETSPMGVVWAFMGASRPYTIFAGLGEVLGGVLLIWRGTTLLGALVSIGVMTNVAMINFCYDVPVKILSTHLWLMGVLILVPDAHRLRALLLANRNPAGDGTPDFWARGRLPWVRWPLKWVVIATCFLFPLGSRAVDLYEQTFASAAPAAPKPENDARPDVDRHLVRSRGYRWISEVPFNR